MRAFWWPALSGTAAALVVASSMSMGSRRAGAQGSRVVEPSPAELAIALGRFDVAEDALYEDIRRTPREPSARGALGAFLAARGRFQIGATLFDEAMVFGGDTAKLQARMLELFRWTVQYDRAAGLRAARLTPEERESMRRAPGTAASGEAFSIVPMQPNESLGIGRISIAVGTELVEADIQPLLPGVQLPATLTMYGMVDVTGARGDTTYAVARSVSIGGVTIGPVPVTLVAGLRVARLGLDVLAQLTPTFDATARTLTVRSTTSRAPGDLLPLLLRFPGVSFVAAEGQPPVLLHTPAGRSAVRGVRWTLDVARGGIVVER